MLNDKLIKQYNLKVFWGFTLAEVLITLGIIGIVAAMTIPTVVSNFQVKGTVSALKEISSVLTQAYTLAMQENGEPKTWNTDNSHITMMGKVTPYLKITESCMGTPGCFPVGKYKYLSGGDWVSLYDYAYAKVRLDNGMSLAYVNGYQYCTYPTGTTQAEQSVCGWLYVDINGDKGPNQFGKDLFKFWFTNYGVVPSGTSTATNDTFATSYCLNGGVLSGGWSCTAWVLYNENMDYLKCTNLNWGGSTTCN